MKAASFFTSPRWGEVDHAKRDRVRGFFVSNLSQYPLTLTLSPEGRGNRFANG
jgi:hypothetical protein